FGAMRPDAVLTEPPTKRVSTKGGRPRVRGVLLPKPQPLAKEAQSPWQNLSVLLYGRRQTIRYKTLAAQWYRACGTRLLRVVVVQSCSELRVFFSSDATLCVAQILEGYARRWNIEVCFRDLKQQLGFADSSARKQAAVERAAPFVGIVYSTIVVWFALGAFRTPLALAPLRPWYRHKRGSSFADILRAAQRALAPLDVLDPRRSIDNLRDPAHASAPQTSPAFSAAA